MSGSLLVRTARPNILELMGPFFLGLIANYLLWGIQITQTYYYYKTFRHARERWCKITVAALFAMDLFQGICASKTGWAFMVDKWGDIDGVVTSADWGSFMMPLTDSITASIVHVFYAQKIWKLLDAPYNYIFTASVLTLSLTQLTAGLGCTIFQFTIHLTLAEFNRINTWVGIWLTTASVTDIFITAAMTWKLSKSRTGFKRTDDVISKIIRLIVETGLATAIVQIVDVVIFLIWPLKPFHNVPTLIAPKVYSNSVLAVLNSRSPPKMDKGWDSQPSHVLTSVGADTVQTISISPKYEMQGNLGSPRPYPSPRPHGYDRESMDPDSDISAAFSDKARSVV